MMRQQLHTMESFFDVLVVGNMVATRDLEITHHALGINSQSTREEQADLEHRTEKAVQQNNVKFFNDLDLNYFLFLLVFKYFFKKIEYF